ncbi:putative DNA methyltransferase YeeA [Lactiplantibacillus plantarum]|nr:putative DNA methyltransferase YeeA [Lactiplantibacillus plantarum]
MVKGSQPTDGGGLIFTRDEREEAVSEFPELSHYIKPFIGSKEYMSGQPRFVLWVDKTQFELIGNIPIIKERINTVIKTRLKSKNKTVNALANTPYKFQHISSYFVNNHDIKSSLLVPRVTSQNRRIYLWELLMSKPLSLTMQCLFTTYLYGY